MSDLQTSSQNLSRVNTEYGEIVLNEVTGAYWHLNETASQVLGVLQQGGTSADAISDLVDRYGIADQRATDDVHSIRKQLKELGAL